MQKALQYLLILISIFSFNSTHAQVTFQKVYGGGNSEASHSAVQTNDGGYVICGYTASYGAGRYDFYVVKTNAYGDTVWTKTYGTASMEWAEWISQTSDNGYIIAGDIQDTSNYKISTCLIRTDDNGNLLWTKSFRVGTFETTLTFVQQTSDHGFILVGSVLETFSRNIYLVKTDSNGALLWSKSFEVSLHNSEGFAVQQTADGGYIISGSSYDINQSIYYNDMYLVKTDSAGGLEWSKLYGGGGNDIAYYIEQANDSGFIVSGLTSSFGAGGNDSYVLKINQGGDVQWSKAYGTADDEFSRCVIRHDDGGYVVVGFPSALIRTDPAGDTLWTRGYGINGTNKYISSVSPTNDGGYIIGGNTQTSGAGSQEYYLIKTDPSGNSGCNEFNASTTVSTAATITTTPSTLEDNPVSYVITPATMTSSGGIVSDLCLDMNVSKTQAAENSVHLSPVPVQTFGIISSEAEIKSIEVCNLVGKKVMTADANRSKDFSIDVAALLPGLYFLKVETAGTIVTLKFVKQ